jgi:proteasome lid subunit RPN8/RPN11
MIGFVEPVRTGERRMLPGGARRGTDVVAQSAQRMLARAARLWPAEACWVLLFGRGPRRIRVSPVPNSAKTTARTRRFAIDPRRLLRIDAAARRVGSRVAGFVHTHTGAGARAVPSAADRGEAWPRTWQVIVALSSPSSAADVGVYRVGRDGRWRRVTTLLLAAVDDHSTPTSST